MYEEKNEMSVKDLVSLGATRFCGPNSRKEGYAVFKPSTLKNEDDWPTLVFECGLSESLRRLRIDAAWWLKNSGGNVNIVVVISIKEAETQIQIEK